MKKYYKLPRVYLIIPPEISYYKIAIWLIPPVFTLSLRDVEDLLAEIYAEWPVLDGSGAG